MRGPRARRLDEHRQAEGLDLALPRTDEVPEAATVTVGATGRPAASKADLHELLVHADGRREHPRAHVAHVEQSRAP